MTLGACSPSISNQQLIKDMLLIPKLYPMDEVKDLTIIQKTSTESEIDYKLSATLISDSIEITADISMSYTKVDAQWEMSKSTVNIVNILAYDPPTLDLAFASVTDYEWIVSHQLSFTSDIRSLSLKSIEDDLAHGKATLFIVSSYKDANFESEIVFEIEAVYDYEKGWGTRLVDYSSSETMRWEGTYEISWTEKEPSGMIPPSPYFQIGVAIPNIVLSGTTTKQTHMDGTGERIDNVEMKIWIKGKDYTLKGYSPDIQRQTNLISFKFLEGYGGVISLEYNPFNERFPSGIIASSDAINGELIPVSTH